MCVNGREVICIIVHNYAIMAHSILFEDIFDVKQINPDGKKFERGSFC